MTLPLNAFEQLELDLQTCDKCPLGATKTNLVFGCGNPHADILFIGEAPGQVEDSCGIPFTGRAGHLLDTLLAGINVARDDVYIANILKCRPPANRDPSKSEIDACTPFLRQQIQFIEPKVIVPMGSFAAKFILGTDAGISKTHGVSFTADAGVFYNKSCHIVPTYHPAYALHDPTKADVLAQDFRKVGKIIGTI